MREWAPSYLYWPPGPVRDQLVAHGVLLLAAQVDLRDPVPQAHPMVNWFWHCFVAQPESNARRSYEPQFLRLSKQRGYERSPRQQWEDRAGIFGKRIDWKALDEAAEKLLREYPDKKETYATESACVVERDRRREALQRAQDDARGRLAYLTIALFGTGDKGVTTETFVQRFELDFWENVRTGWPTDGVRARMFAYLIEAGFTVGELVSILEGGDRWDEAVLIGLCAGPGDVALGA